MRKLGVDVNAWDNELKLLDKLAKDRKDLCDNILQVDEATSKHILQEVFNGAQLPMSHEQIKFLHEVADLGNWFRYIAIEALPHGFDVLEDTEACEWPTASVASHLYFGAEAFV